MAGSSVGTPLPDSTRFLAHLDLKDHYARDPEIEFHIRGLRPGNPRSSICLPQARTRTIAARRSTRHWLLEGLVCFLRMMSARFTAIHDGLRHGLEDDDTPCLIKPISMRDRMLKATQLRREPCDQGYAEWRLAATLFLAGAAVIHKPRRVLKPRISRGAVDKEMRDTTTLTTPRDHAGTTSTSSHAHLPLC